MQKLLIIFLVSFISINCLLEELINLDLNVIEVINQEVGKKGTIFLAAELEKGETTIKRIKRETCFKSKVSNSGSIYEVDCGLHNTMEKAKSTFLFCNIGENIPFGKNTILISELAPFVYGNYNITLKNRKGKGDPTFKKVDKDICDLYSDEQTITIEKSVDNYELKFNIVSYNKEILIFNENMVLDNCKAQNDILVCPITKSELLSQFCTSYINRVEYLNTKDNKVELLYGIEGINIIVKDIPKNDIFVGIKKLLTNTSEAGAPIVYETNVTNISNYYNPDFNFKSFKLNFTYNNGYREYVEKFNCIFAK